MQFDGRAISGPVLAAATMLAAIAIDRCLIGVPNPAPLLVLITALAGSWSGFRSGLVSAGIAIVGSALFFLDHRATLGYQASDLVRLAMLAVTVGATAAITGLMRRQLVDSFAHERAEHLTAQRLAAALDEVDIGIVLLDADTRAAFINRAFRSYFSLPDAKADSRPAFVALMYHGRDSGAYELPADQLKAFIARRMEMMRIGDSTPINIRLKDGTVLRFSCTALPDGGRMLSYTPVTDLVRRDDDPRDGEYLRALRGGDRTPAPQLRAAE
ncbi:MAG TPA: PAS-domain containing protein [Bradyrhizobium sp.]|nr:PAS-domain containing protein [Bradyrhizobium sp.]